MRIGDSPVGSSKTPMEHRFGLILASGHYLDPALHWRGSAKVRGYPSTVRRCFDDAASALN
ncbi:hypothetical protein HAX54_050924, partial [Datura stramonium]|nr:hypothetical protein [Datura stramonium]